jgi:hypothetical protein
MFIVKHQQRVVGVNEVLQVEIAYTVPYEYSILLYHMP